MLGIAIVISLGVMLLGAIIITFTFWFEVLFGDGVDFDRELNLGLALVMAGLLLLALTAFLYIISVFF